MAQRTALAVAESVRWLGKAQNHVGGSQERCPGPRQKPSSAYPLPYPLDEFFCSHPRLLVSS